MAKKIQKVSDRLRRPAIARRRRPRQRTKMKELWKRSGIRSKQPAAKRRSPAARRILNDREYFFDKPEPREASDENGHHS